MVLLMRDWKSTRLGDVIITNAQSYSNKDNWQYVNYLDTGNITENRVDEIQFIDLTVEKLPSRAKRKVNYNSIIYSTVRPNQLHYGIIKNQPKNFLVSTGFTVIDVDDRKADPNFIYYILTQREITERLQAIGEQSVSAYPSIKPSDIEDIEIDLPALEEQKRVVSILNAIDSKIESNREINNNLEQQAQAIFKEWFIDNPENENWSNGTFSELIQSTLSGDWGKEAPTGNNTEKVYCVRGADIPEVRAGNKGKMPTRYILPKNYASKKLTAGDIVVEISGGNPTQSTGRCTAISESLLNRYDSGMVCTNFCRAIKPLSGYSMFIYYYWQYLYNKGVFFSYENGTTGIKNLDISGFLGTEPIIIPPKEKVLAFDDYCQTVFDRIFANGKESEQLSQLRDTILPKLMSGELDVSDIEI